MYIHTYTYTYCHRQDRSTLPEQTNTLDAALLFPLSE